MVRLLNPKSLKHNAILFFFFLHIALILLSIRIAELDSVKNIRSKRYDLKKIMDTALESEFRKPEVQRNAV